MAIPLYGDDPGNVYEQVVLKYLKKLRISGRNMGPHVMRATAATNDWITAQILPRCRSGWGMPILPPPGSMITARPGQRIA
jgi:hypothetical protein